jgi:hypothetical protein
MIAAAASAIWLAFVTGRDLGHRLAHSARVALAVLVAPALLSVLISLVDSDAAMWACALNLGPALSERLGRTPRSRRTDRV